MAYLVFHVGMTIGLSFNTFFLPNIRNNSSTNITISKSEAQNENQEEKNWIKSGQTQTSTEGQSHNLMTKLILFKEIQLPDSQIGILMNKKWNIRNVCLIPTRNAKNEEEDISLIDSLTKGTEQDSLNNPKLDESNELHNKKQNYDIFLNFAHNCFTFHLPDHLNLPKNAESRDFLINLIDLSIGNGNNVSDVTAVLRLTDGNVIFVDEIEGIGLYTKVNLKQGLSERNRPVLMIDNIATSLLDSKITYEVINQIQFWYFNHFFLSNFF